MNINLLDDIWMIGTYNNNFYQVQDSTQLNSWDHVRGLANRNPDLILVYDIYFHYLKSNNFLNPLLLNYQPQNLKDFFKYDFEGLCGYPANPMAHFSYPRIYIQAVNFLNRKSLPILQILETCSNGHYRNFQYITGSTGLQLKCITCKKKVNLNTMLI
jgi:hypothetical protein